MPNLKKTSGLGQLSQKEIDLIRSKPTGFGQLTDQEIKIILKQASPTKRKNITA